jgi:outer membrane protein TolC
MRPIGIIVSLCLTVSVAGARTITVEEAVALALSGNPSQQALRAERSSSEDNARAARGTLFPSFRVTNEYDHYNGPFTLDLPNGNMVIPFTVRNEDTNTFTADGRQPLLGLFARSHAFLDARRSAEANDARYRAASANLRELVEGTYLRYFDYVAEEKIALASQAELAQQAAIGRSQVKGGILTRADQLRIETAAANSAQTAIAARTQMRIALATLLAAIGLSADGSGIDLVEPRALLEAAVPGSEPFDRLWRASLERRPERIQLDREANAANHRRWVSFGDLIPAIDLIGAYTHVNGQLFLPVDQAYVGVRASFTVWDFGALYYRFRAESDLADAARARVAGERLQIGAEIAGALAQVDEAVHAITVAETAIAGAEEAFRETDAQLKAGTATTTDLVVTEAALTEARLNLVRARYARAVALVHLRRVTGR